MCGPLCGISLIGGLWLSRQLGIDDLTLGLWAGALILSLAIQFNKFLEKRGKAFIFSAGVSAILLWLISFLSIWRQLDWDASNCFYGLPRVILGSLMGMIVLFIGDWFNAVILKKFHNNKAYFPYQRVIAPLIGLIIASVIFEMWFCQIFT